MGKIIISLPLLGLSFNTVMTKHIETLSQEMGYNKDEIIKELNSSGDGKTFKDNIKKHFGDKLKIIIE